MAGNSGKAAGRGRPFRPGTSGNPNGRPKVAVEFRARARAVTDELVIDRWETEVRTMGDNWLKASELLAAYGYGKPASSPEDLNALTHVGPLAPREVALAALRRLAQLEDGGKPDGE